MGRNLQHIARLSGLMALCLVAGCASFRQTVSRIYYAPQLKRADAAFQAQEYALAATRYESLRDRYPAGDQRELMMMNQALAYYKLGSYHDARDLYLQCLTEYPRGIYCDEARANLKKIDVLMMPPRPAEKQLLDQAQADLNKLQDLHRKYPNDPEVDYALGNLYYEMGDYQEAIRYYYDAQMLDAAYKEKDLISKRMAIGPDGKPVALTPETIERIEKNDNPLVAFNLKDYKARDPGTSYLSGSPEIYFTVTGLIRNQSEKLLRGVTIEVRFLDAHHNLLDVQNVNIGSMGSDEVRAFQAATSRYDNLYNIAEYQCIPRWEH